MKKIRYQKGFTIFELIIVVTIMIIIMGFTTKAMMRDISNDRAKAAGHDFAEYLYGVSAWIFSQGLGAPAGTYNDTNWLKEAATCVGGTGTDDFLPCGFSNSAGFGTSYRTVVTNVAGTVTATITLLGTPIREQGRLRPALGGIITRTADATRLTVTGVAAGNMGVISYNMNPVTGIVNGTVTTATTADPWLRLDGTNQMLVDLNAGGNNLINIGNINATGTVTANRVDANQVAVTGNITATGRMNASDFASTVKNRTLTQSVSDVNVVGNNGFIASPSCGTLTPQVFVSAMMYSKDATGEPIGALQTWANTAAGGWTVHMRILLPSGWFTPSATYGKILAFTKCT